MGYHDYIHTTQDLGNAIHILEQNRGICKLCPHTRAEEKLRALRSRLGEKACHLVQLNTRDKDSRDAGFDNLFKAHRQSVVPGGGAGEPQHQPDTPPEVS